MRSRPRLALLIALIGVVLARGGTVSAGEDLAARVKAAMLVRFARYVKWPTARHSSAKSPIVIGVLSDDAVLRAAIADAKGKKIGKRGITVRELVPDAAGDVAAADWKSCHVIFIGQKARTTTETVAKSAIKHHVLTVSDRKGFVAGGGVIEFVVRDKKMKFRVSREAAKNARLKLSSKLLKLGVK